MTISVLVGQCLETSKHAYIYVGDYLRYCEPLLSVFGHTNKRDSGVVVKTPSNYIPFMPFSSWIGFPVTGTVTRLSEQRCDTKHLKYNCFPFAHYWDTMNVAYELHQNFL